MSDAGAARTLQGRPELPVPRARKAIRVLLFFVYFFGLGFAVPWLVVSWIQAEYGPIDGPPSGVWSVDQGGFTNSRAVLGTADPVIDMRAMFPFAAASALNVDGNATITIAIVTASAEDLQRGISIIEQQYQVTIPDGAAQKLGSEGIWHGIVRRDDRHLLLVLAREPAAAEQRLAAVAPMPTPADQASEAFGEKIKTATLAGIFIWTALQFYFFGRIASWAGGEPAVAGIAPISAEALMARLLALNQQDIPFTISRGTRPNEIIIDWRYADAKWLDLMRIHGMRGAYRLVLRLDADKHNARAQDRYSSFEWSAGRGPDLANLKWKASSGITFYEYKHERVFGLQFKDGKPTFDLSYAYTFALDELKQPVIDIIRNAGWNFRPVITFFRPIGG